MTHVKKTFTVVYLAIEGIDETLNRSLWSCDSLHRIPFLVPLLTE